MKRLFLLIGIMTMMLSQGLIGDDQTNDLALNTPPQDKSKEESSIMANKKIKIINLGEIVNHKGFDYAPTISADGKTLYYVSNREGSVESDGDPTHDFWVAKKDNRLDTIFQTPFNLDLSNPDPVSGVNTTYNEGAASIAADRQSLYFTGCERPGGLGDCDIYLTTIEGEKWGRPINLGKNVNSKNWDSQPSITADQSRIYFVSTRKGPNSDGENVPENMDIWYSDYDFDLEEWGPAKNLEALNTKGQEVSPFIGADGVTLFFASNGHEPNVGGLDFYVARANMGDGSWSTPENLGEPINTKDNEQFITLPASGDIIYWSSTRDDLEGYQGTLDIFMAFVPSFFRAVNITGTVVDDCSGEFIASKIIIKNPITGKIIEDSVTSSRQVFEKIVVNDDYGDPKDSVKYINFEITAMNDKYGKKTIVQKVEKPETTTDESQANEVAIEYDVEIRLGQQPVIMAEVKQGDWATKRMGKIAALDGFDGLVMKKTATWDLYPLLNYVFFDKGVSDIPERYILFPDKAYTTAFNDTTIPGGTLDKYYHLLNIYGFRLNQYPDMKIQVIGCNDNTTPEEKANKELSKTRATNVYNYFKDVWGISEDRMELVVRNFPEKKARPTDEEHHQENRRVEIVVTNGNLDQKWNIIKPVFETDPKIFPQPEQMEWIMTNGIEDNLIASKRIEIYKGSDLWKTIDGISTEMSSTNWDWLNTSGSYPVPADGEYDNERDENSFSAKLIVTTTGGAECESDPVNVPIIYAADVSRGIVESGATTKENYSLILFPFNSYQAGPLNDRIMKDYVYDRVKGSSDIKVIGHTDITGLYKTNKMLSVNRAKTVYTGIRSKSKGKYGSLETEGVGEDDPLYTNDLPEGRMYNRTVQVLIETPLTEYVDQ